MLNIAIKEKQFNKTTVLQNINIVAKVGEFISIIGPSGCGKTTLLNIISSLEKEFDGCLDGDFSSLSFMFQDDRLLPWLTVKENLLLVSKSKNEKEIDDLISLINLENILNEYPNRLSGGMKRRVALVRAFINRPKIILLDEPFISLDFPTSMKLKNEFLKFYEKFKPTVILVTHDLSEAIYMSNRIVFFSSNPTTKILDFENNDNQKESLKKVDEIKNQILEDYPKILEGEI